MKKNKKKGILFWITGLPGSGKTAVAQKIRKDIQKLYGPTLVVSGDNLRKIFGFNKYTSEERIITIRLYLEKATNLDHLINEFKKNNINLNKKGVFEYIENKKTVFTIANLYEPGYFKDALNIRGLTFFFITSNPIEDKKALNKMYSHAYEVNSNIEGKIYDDQGKIINDQNYIDILNERT